MAWASLGWLRPGVDMQQKLLLCSQGLRDGTQNEVNVGCLFVEHGAGVGKGLLGVGESVDSRRAGLGSSFLPLRRDIDHVRTTCALDCIALFLSYKTYRDACPLSAQSGTSCSLRPWGFA